MRPGQAAPECTSYHPKPFIGKGASMRPGQAAPECVQAKEVADAAAESFNEAGAGCPGMLRSPLLKDMLSFWLQ